MTKYSSADVSHFGVGGYDLLGNSTAIGIGKSTEVKDTTGFGMAWREFAPINLRTGELTQDGFFDTAVGKTHDAFVAGNGLSRVGVISVVPSAIGAAFIGFQGALQTAYERKVAVGELHTAKASYVVNGKVEEGVLLNACGTPVTANGNSEASDVHDVAAPTTGGAGYLSVTNLVLGSATNFAVILRHSDDGVTWSTLASFTVRTAIGAERIAIAGEIKDYVAAQWTWNGGAGGSSATFAVGVVRDASN